MQHTIFISWSGDRARAAAAALERFLTGLNQRTWAPWTSSKIAAARPWPPALFEALNKAHFGILCVTAENLGSSWLLFEAGALAKSVRANSDQQPADDLLVCPLLIGPEIAIDDLPPPLVQFNAVLANRDGIVDLLRSLWKFVSDDEMPPDFVANHELAIDGLLVEFRKIERSFNRAERFVSSVSNIASYEDLELDFRSTLQTLPAPREMFIYNAEMNTLETPGIWKRILDPAQFSKVCLCLPPKAYRRLESKLRDRKEMFQLFKSSGDALEIKIAEPSDEFRHLGFAVMSSAGGRARKVAYLFPKEEPFSALVDEGSPCRYLTFIRTRLPDVVTRLENEIDRARMTHHGIAIDRILRFVEGSSLPVDQVRAEHQLEETLSRRILLEYPLSSAIVESHLEKRGKLDALPKSVSNRYVLWTGPWGFPAAQWKDVVDPINRSIADVAGVIHVDLRHNGNGYTFTQAELDLECALTRLERMNGDCQVVLCSTSVNGYIAAAVAARHPTVKGLMLISAAADLLEALDRFRGCDVSLFTRRVCFAQDGYRFGENRETTIQYFGKKVDWFHMLDLQVRGMRMCGSEYFVSNLEEIVMRGARVRLWHCATDQMTAGVEIEAAVDEVERRTGIQVPVFETAWRHDLTNQQFYADGVDLLASGAHSSLVTAIRDAFACATSGRTVPD